MGTLERRTRVKDSLVLKDSLVAMVVVVVVEEEEEEERSEKREAMRVYWVEGEMEVGVVRAWWGVYSPDWERMSWFVSLEVKKGGIREWG
jgi:hypothetical protein